MQHTVNMIRYLILTFCLPYALSYNNSTINYLQIYGYLNQDDSSLTAASSALKLFQTIHSLPADGQENEETIRFMNRSRCGVEDNFTPFMVDSSKYKWGGQNLTWTIYPVKYFLVAEKAFSLWSKHSGLGFHHDQHKPNITISFASRKHLCTTNRWNFCFKDFDGLGGVLAHAEFPSEDREQVEIHVDENEHWNGALMIPADDELSLYSVLIHEIGHALGLQHTSHKNSIMYPYYYFPDFIKHIDDIDLQTPEIDAIQLLYGEEKKKTVTKPTTTTTTTTTTPKPIPPFQPPLLADICQFKNGDYVGDISNVFPGIPRNVSTAFKGIDGCLYFKANDLFYIYNEFLESSVGTLNNPLSLFDIECNERDNIINDIHGLVKKLWYKQSTQVTTATTTTTTTTSVDEIYDSLNI
ncbi:matrix metalloproteinase-26-like [Rhodnius prolixus]|uniref:matrix metalloproteinase-26-like n=1 Tax=Rhodnius prolixus TaxID=13249 RepID=UPI003D18EE41